MTVATESAMVEVLSSTQVKYETAITITTSNYELVCGDDQIVFDNKYNEIPVSMLSLNTKIVTAVGPQPVLSISVTNRPIEITCLTVAGPYFRYLSNGILLKSN